MLEVGVAAGAVADLEVGLLGDDVAQGDRHLQGELDVRPVAAEELELGHHELAAERGRHRHPQPRRHGRRALARQLAQRGERDADLLQVGRALGGRGEVAAREQPHAEVGLELAQAVAHRAHGHAQLFGRTARAAQARDRLEGEQALDGRDASMGHGGGAWGDVREDAKTADAPIMRATAAAGIGDDAARPWQAGDTRGVRPRGLSLP